MQKIMEQFSHDLKNALEESSRVRAGRWGTRRRTRSTGNLPCAPLPTEDSSSESAQNNQNQDGLTNIMLSDSDDRQDFKFSFKSRHAGNFESDSLNENFSPARFFRPNTRRKRKFKRMAVEYETTPSTPGATCENMHPIFPISGTVKKRVLKHTTQDNFRTNFFFCGKRKRSHRDRYYDHEHYKTHSSSVPRQRDFFAQKNSYQEHKTRTRSFSTASKPSCERILPLNKSIVSKIEQISQQRPKAEDAGFFSFTPIVLNVNSTTANIAEVVNAVQKSQVDTVPRRSSLFVQQNEPESGQNPKQHPKKSGSFELPFEKSLTINNTISSLGGGRTSDKKSSSISEMIEINPITHRRKHKHSRLKRQQMCAKLQFEDPNSMECSNLNEFLSSSSLSSSDSEAAETNDSDREGDDELTDWPGNEVMINFASKNEFRRSGKKTTLSPDDICPDDTLMSGEDTIPTTTAGGFPLPIALKPIQSQPIAITGLGVDSQLRFPVRQIESEMSGETSNNFLSSPCYSAEIREIRAGCRRVREERPGFTIMTSINERLARFLQDARQAQLRLPDVELHEHENLMHLARLYSLQMVSDKGCAVLTKTSNTTQSVKIDQQNFSSRFLLSDYKRRCYDGRVDHINEKDLIDCHDKDFDEHPIGVGVGVGGEKSSSPVTITTGSECTKTFGMTN